MSYTYTICSLAVGKNYSDILIDTFKKIQSITSTPQLLVVADSSFPPQERVTIIDCDLYPIRTQDERFFNYNLKFAPIKHSISLQTDYIVFIDADWSVNTGFSDEKFYNLFTHMEKCNIDFAFERPHQIGASKKELHNCFWRHKIEPFGLDKTEKYDLAHVCNEQCLVFKNNKKLDVFVAHWEQLFNRVYEESIWPFAEGVEIGMAATEAEMNGDWSALNYLQNCFSFCSYNGTYYERF